MHVVVEKVSHGPDQADACNLEAVVAFFSPLPRN